MVRRAGFAHHQAAQHFTIKYSNSYVVIKIWTGGHDSRKFLIKQNLRETGFDRTIYGNKKLDPFLE